MLKFLLTIVTALQIPVWHIQTVDSVFPSCDWVQSPDGSSWSISNPDTVPGRLYITTPQNQTIYDSGDYLKGESGITIRRRGNTSNFLTKKPYRIKLQSKADLLFRGNDNKYKDKDWVLLQSDSLQTLTGNMLNEMTGMPWTPAMQYVWLEMNGQDLGLYILCENVKRNTKCRINVSNLGYIFEYDPYWWNEDYYIPSYFPNYYNYTLKYPDTDDLLPWQDTFITDAIHQMEQQYRNPEGCLDSLMDIESFVRWVWVHEINGDNDYAGSNMYFTKFDTLPTSPIQLACAWDFSGSHKVVNDWIHAHWWFHSFFITVRQYSVIREFVRQYDDVVAPLIPALIDSLTALQSSPFEAALDTAVSRDNLLYGTSVPTASQQFSRAISFFTQRSAWLATAIEDYRLLLMQHDQPTGIDPIRTTGDVRHIIAIYSIDGTKRPHLMRGINIVLFSDGTTEKIMRND